MLQMFSSSMSNAGRREPGATVTAEKKHMLLRRHGHAALPAPLLHPQLLTWGACRT